MKKTLLLATLSLYATTLFAYEARYTKGQIEGNVDQMLARAQKDSGIEFKRENLIQIEDRKLATSRFQMYVQVNQSIPVSGTAIRIWTDLNSGKLILGEMHLNDQHVILANKFRATLMQAKINAGMLKSKKLASAVNKLASSVVKGHKTDGRIISMSFQDQWENNDLVRVVKVTSRRGHHIVRISLLTNKMTEKTYQEFPQGETHTSLQANVFPIYEQVESNGEILSTEVKELKFINTQIADGGEDPFAAMKDNKYQEKFYNPILAETEFGQSMGIWSEYSIKRDVEAIVAGLPLKSNDLSSGLLLSGKYATINIHPNAKEAFKGIQFDLKAATQHLLGWKIVEGAYEATPVAGLAGKPITSQEDLLNLKPVRLPDHDPVQYINSGFDEVQVYYAVTVLMDALNEMGFTDPEYSSRPFHAFLFDPDIGMRDNAYYTNDTINFTTYNPGIPNLARDNPTIWHEIGHGIMDRLMGAFLTFGDTKAGYGGLSEGMADFVAQLVLVHQVGNKNFPGKDEFRIINETGFYLTNEFHDEGEAYGGAMNDMLSQVLKSEGRAGLFRFTDLTLETMRLSRNHPALTARLWFEQMLYVDELGGNDRSSGQYNEIISQALLARNFSFKKSFKASSMKVTFGETELTSLSDASREKPISACDVSGVASFNLKVSLKNEDADYIKFPATVKVEYKKGALQGAIDWKGEESNPNVYTVNSAGEILDIKLQASMKCESVNQPSDSCKDYAYLQVFQPGQSKPIAKKRFYLLIKNNSNCI